MHDLRQKKQQLKEILPLEGIAETVRQLKSFIPKYSPKYDELLLIESRQNETNRKRLRDVVSDQELQIAYNKIRVELLGLIDSLSQEDFDLNVAASKISPSKKAKRGSILHRIPRKMQLMKETRCVVRIALDEETIIQNIDLDEHAKLETIRISDVMQVELLDPTAECPFSIRTISAAEQFIDEDDYTEWLFFVKPLKHGVFPLMLKVSVIELVYNKERRREIVLEQEVDIVALHKEDEPSGSFEKAGYQLNFAPDGSVQTADSAPPTPSLQKFRGKLARKGALVMAGLLIAMGSTWAAAPAQVEWVALRYLIDNDNGYAWYIDRHKDKSLRENAFLRQAEIQNSPEKSVEVYHEYLEEYPKSGKFRKVARWEIAKLEDTPIAYLEYLREDPTATIASKESVDIPQIETRVVEKIASISDSTEISKIEDLLTEISNTNVEEKAKAKIQGFKLKKEQLKVWTATQGLNTYEAYQQFLRKYPDSPFSGKAQKASHRVAERAWNTAARTNTYEGYQQFLDEYPDSPFSGQAREVVTDLIDNSWKTAAQKGSLEAVEAFMEDYPNSVHIAKAEILLNEINDSIVQLQQKIRELKPYSYSGSDFERNNEKRLAYEPVIALAEQLLRLRDNARDRRNFAEYYNSLAWYDLLSKEFKAAEKHVRRGLELNYSNLMLHTNLPPALLFQGKIDDAKAMYESLKDQPYAPERGFPYYKDVFIKDFREFGNAGIIPKEHMETVEEIKKMLRK